MFSSLMKNLEIGFNSRYLLDIISEIDGTDVTLNFSDPAAPVLIIDDAEDNLFFVSNANAHLKCSPVFIFQI